jgi:hypothetical protein
MENREDGENNDMLNTFKKNLTHGSGTKNLDGTVGGGFNDTIDRFDPAALRNKMKSK